MVGADPYRPAVAGGLDGPAGSCTSDGLLVHVRGRIDRVEPAVAWGRPAAGSVTTGGRASEVAV